MAKQKKKTETEEERRKRRLQRFVEPWYGGKWVGTWDPKTQKILPPTEDMLAANAAVDKERRRLAGPEAEKARRESMERFIQRMDIPEGSMHHVGTWDPKTGRVIPDERTDPPAITTGAASGLVADELEEPSVAAGSSGPRSSSNAPGEPSGRASQAHDRARGLMAGIAAGNLLGIVQEGWPRELIAAEFPDGVREIAADPGHPDDDDVAQAIVVAEAAAEGPLDPHDLGRRFWEWVEVNGAGMGGLTGDVLTRYGGRRPLCLARNRTRSRERLVEPIQNRTDEVAAGHVAVREPVGVPITEASRAAWRGSSAGNGAAMRCAPIAIRWRGETAALVRNSILSAVPTHWDRRCGWSCALLNLAAAAALRGEAISADGLLAAGLDGVRVSLPDLQRYGYEARVPESVRAAVRQASEGDVDAPDVDGASRGYTLLALRIGLTAYWRAPDFEQGLRSVVEAGGDTDTNGAIAGALLGARFGIEAIPRRWRDRVAEIRAGRTPMESYAERLLAARAA